MGRNSEVRLDPLFSIFLTRIMLKIADLAPESPRLRADRGKSADALARFLRPKALYHPKQHLTVLEQIAITRNRLIA
jgi:hypothetical protein